MTVFKQLFKGWNKLFTGFSISDLFMNFTTWNWGIAIFFTSALMLLERKYQHIDIEELIGKQSKWLRYGIYYSAFLILYFFGVYRQSSFIYFQF